MADPVTTTPPAPSNTGAAPSFGANTVTTGGLTMPQWYQDLGLNFANNINNAANTAGGLAQNWYGQPVAAPTTGLQDQAATGAVTPYDPTTGLNKAQGALDQYQTQFDPTKLASFMSPYTGQAMNTVAQLGAQNLRENTLPAVNSTFTGAGQFGSTRNGEFNARALRDEGRNVLNQQGTLLNGQYNNAMTQMQAWNQNPVTAAQAQAGLTTTGQNAFWDNLNKQYNMGSQLQGSEQNQLDKNYQDWLQSVTLPTQQLGGLSNMVPSISQIYSRAPVSTSQTTVPANSPGVLGGLGALLNAGGTLLS